MASIKVYARIRPAKSPTERITLLERTISAVTGNAESSEVTTRHCAVPQLIRDFTFTHVFNADTSCQADVFETVGKEIAVKFLDGYNGTIFAYGQTGSGKTYTMEGSARRFSERGLIPRVLSFVYSELERRSDSEEFVVHISYMEIYQDCGYDLLNPGNTSDAAMMTQLPKVSVVEGADGNVKVKNLSLHLSANEEVAQNLLFQGRMNRRVAETSMNMKSSRSHAIFTIILTATAAGSEVITRSKLHLVDLAGSERVSKTGADGKILMEAKYINLSLHYLEHVIVLLQRQTGRPNSSGSVGRRSHSSHERHANSAGYSTSSPSIGSRRQSRKRLHSSRSSQHAGFIPYRNSLLTMVLKDSLGGNCLTAMIATLSIEEVNFGETVSTCRFAQRVACIENSVRRNEELDDKAVIKRLKCRIAELESELAMLKRKHSAEPKASVDSDQLQAALTEGETKICHRALYDFLHGKVDNPVRAGIDDTRKFAECLVVMKQIVLHALGVDGKSHHSQRKGNDATKQTEDMARTSKHPKPMISTPKTAPASQSLSFCKSSDMSAGSNTAVINNNVRDDNKQVSEPTYNSGMDSFTGKAHISKTVQQTPTPTSSGIGSMVDEDVTTTSKTIPQHNVGISSKKCDAAEKRIESISPPMKHSHRHKRTNSNRHTLHHAGTANLQYSKSDHHQLKSDVQKLALSVEEEEIRGQIALLREQIAGQHARILWMERSHTSHDEIHQEKLAEYHLRIKEAHLQQKLLQVSQQIKSGETPAPLADKQYSQQLRDELLQYSKEQNKVQLQIEELKHVQMEKQLLLKETATRKRLLALKQQIQADNITPPMSKELGSKTAYLPVTPKTAQSETLDTMKHENGHAQLSQSVNGNWPSRLKYKSSPPPPTTTNSSMEHLSIKSSVKGEKPLRHKQSTFQSLLPDTSKLFDKPHLTAHETNQNTSTSISEKEKPVVKNETRSTVTTSESPSAEKFNARASDHEQSSTIIKQKLIVPDTIRETQYMSAVMKQKARVSRIRKAMHAAEVIQRAWRKYKQNCVT